MGHPRLSIVVAMTPQRVIGRHGQLPWHLSADLRRFKQLTWGHHIVMGRKTFDSIGRLLPGRTTVVVSRQPDLTIPGAHIAHSITEAVHQCLADSEVFIVGGEQVYREAIPLADRIYLTVVHVNVTGDTFFPELSQEQWQLTEQQPHQADEKNPYDYTFQIWKRQEQ
jgi:dihydrofolate reductase